MPSMFLLFGPDLPGAHRISGTGIELMQIDEIMKKLKAAEPTIVEGPSIPE